MSGENANNPSVFQLKASLYTLTTLHLLENNLAALDAQLSKLRQQAPKFLNNAPVIVDLQRLNPEGTENFAFDEMQALFKNHELIIVGLRHVPDVLQADAKKAGFGILPNATASKTSGGAHSSELGAAKPLDAKALEAAKAKAKEGDPALRLAQASENSANASDANTSESSAAPTMIITTPVRSGQQIYAKDADLIITSVVGHGAEVIADGNIHIYGTLKGRALAGARGNTQARIFCHELSPELISIAGTYWLNDDVLARAKGKKGPVQIFLKNDELQMEALA